MSFGSGGASGSGVGSGGSAPPSFLIGSGVSAVGIADRLTEANLVRLPATSNLQVSWEIDRAGLLTCDVPVRDLAALGVDHRALLGKWLYYHHATAGPWGGQITTVTVADGVVTIGGESWASLLRGSLTTGVKGGLIGALTQEINAARPKTGISIQAGLGDHGSGSPDLNALMGALAGAQTAGQDIYEQYLPAILSAWNEHVGWRDGLRGASWNVDPVTRVLSIRLQYPRDVSASVSLNDGVHAVRSSYSDDTADVFNTILLTAPVSYAPGDSHLPYVGTRERTEFGFNAASVGIYGPRSLALRTSGVFAGEQQHRQALNDRLTRFSRNQQLVTIECADIGGVWRTFREGYVVSCNLANSGASGQMVVRQRALDLARGVMIVSGEAELS